MCVYEDLLTTSVIEYPTMAEAEEAMRRLAGVDINGQPVKLEFVRISTP